MIRENVANFDNNSALDRERKMDGNNLHTSLVIELPNEKEPDRVNKFKIDFEDVEASKEYVIDELFCGDEVAVYALFEASDISSSKSQKQFMTVSSSDFNGEDFRFTRNCFSRRREGKDPEELCFERRNDDFIHCRNESRQESRKSESTSTGVNTDIGQSPKLLEEVQKMVSLNLSKMDEKSVDLSSMFSVKSSRELMGRVSSMTFCSERENQGKNSAANVVIVPVIIKDEKLSQRRSEKLEKLTSKTSVLEKVSVTTSTSLIPVKLGKSEDFETPRNEASEKGEKNSKSEQQLREELKNLQEKFNALVNSLERIGFTFHEKKETQPEEEPKPSHNNFHKFDDIPIFTTGNFHYIRQSEKSTNNEMEEEVQPIASYSSGFIKDLMDNIAMSNDKINELMLEEIYSPEKRMGKLDLPEAINMKDVGNYKSVRLSKSQTSIRCVRSKNPPGVKKSQSMDMGEEAVVLKKLGNVFFKQDGVVKKQKNKAMRQIEYELVTKLNEMKFSDLQKRKTSEGLLKIDRNKLNKSSEKSLLETANRMNVDSGDARDPKIKRSGFKGKNVEKFKFENKIPYQELKQKLKSVGRRGMVKETGQSKLHVDLLIKNFQNCEQKYTTSSKSNSPRLPRGNCQKKDYKPTEEKSSELSVTKNLEKEEMSGNEMGALEDGFPPSSEVIVELFSKKPASIENFQSEVDLDCFYNDYDFKRCGGSENSSESQNGVVKSVWALTKVLLYEDGTKKMEVLEASLSPPGYHLNQNLTEDKVR